MTGADATGAPVPDGVVAGAPDQPDRVQAEATAPLGPGQAGFYDNIAPALPSGDYQLIVQHTVQVDGQAEPPYAAVQRFRVAGSRIALGATDVVATSPGRGSQGDYDSWLPHVVLAQRDLPWQLPIADAAPASVPWLALLVLTRDEIDVAGAPPGAGSTGVQTVALNDYLAPPTATLGPQRTTGLANLQQEQPGVTCTVVDVDFAAFRAVAPETSELPFLVHVRQVDTSDQEELEVPAPGWYSIILANRFPIGAADGVYVAHLVSLEGFGGALPDQPAPTGYSRVRLLSLASWSFISGPDPGDFAELMQRVDISPFTVPVAIAGTDAASQLVDQAIADGYTALNYVTRFGEGTTAWYRGPLQPDGVAANPQPAYESAAAALIYDPATGMFDASYAAAWEIGRLLTLANGPVALSVSQWVAAATAAARLLLERDDVGAAAADRAGVPAPATDDRPTTDDRGTAARQVVAHQVVQALLGAAGTAPALGVAGDPAGLDGRRLPGLVDPATVRQLVHEADDPYARLYEHAIATARGATTSDQRPPATPGGGPQ